MKSKKQVIADNPDYTKLINAVIRQLGGMESIKDINSNGIQGGYSGFIYYSDTVKFAKNNRSEIVKLLEDMADQLEEDVVAMVSGFGVFRNNPMDAEDKKELYSFLSGRVTGTVIPNLMAWFAAEEVCRMFED